MLIQYTILYTGKATYMQWQLSEQTQYCNRILQKMVQWLDDNNGIENNDLDPIDDRLIAALEQFSANFSKIIEEY